MNTTFNITTRPPRKEPTPPVETTQHYAIIEMHYRDGKAPLVHQTDMYETMMEVKEAAFSFIYDDDNNKIVFEKAVMNAYTVTSSHRVLTFKL